MGFLEEYPALKRSKVVIPSEVLMCAPVLSDLGISKLFFTSNITERKLAISKNNNFMGEANGIFIYKMQNGTICGITQLRAKLPISRFYAYVVEISSRGDISEDIASSRGKLILRTDVGGMAVVYILKNDSQTIRVRLKLEVSSNDV